LQTLPITPIFRDYVGRTGHQRNWIFDVSEEDIVKSRSVIKNIGAVFHSVGIRLAIDNFSGRILTRSDLEELPVSEIKLRPKFVTNCDSKLDHSDVCKGLIDLAHNFQCTAVAIGVETTEQCLALQRMGCDVGQGFLFGHPLPLEQFIGMVRRRSIKDRSKTAASAS
jgi:EAL domain-containing protein (putative c-di-GMP-specific phosphodiesterase class I)